MAKNKKSIFETILRVGTLSRVLIIFSFAYILIGIGIFVPIAVNEDPNRTLMIIFLCAYLGVYIIVMSLLILNHYQKDK